MGMVLSADDTSRDFRTAIERDADHRWIFAASYKARGYSVDDAALLYLWFDWATDETVRSKILIDNPAELYGFH